MSERVSKVFKDFSRKKKAKRSILRVELIKVTVFHNLFFDVSVGPPVDLGGDPNPQGFEPLPTQRVPYFEESIFWLTDPKIFNAFLACFFFKLLAAQKIW